MERSRAASRRVARAANMPVSAWLVCRRAVDEWMRSSVAGPDRMGQGQKEALADLVAAIKR